METVDSEFLTQAVRYIRETVAAGIPFFLWFNTTHMHFRTYTTEAVKGQAGRWQSVYHDVMIEHDKHVGVLLDLLDELGIANDTLVFYSTDNGPHCNSWPDAGTTPFRSEKNTNWEGAFRVPALVRWTGHIPAGTICNDIVAHLDWFPTFAAIAGDTTVKERLLEGTELDGRHYKVMLDGYNILPLLKGEARSPRDGFFYFNDDGDLVALRYDNWKVVFLEQRAEGQLRVWAEPFTELRVPKIFNLRTDPFEFADVTSNSYYDWLLNKAFMLVPAQMLTGRFLETFRDFPPRQKAASFTLTRVIEKLQQGASGSA
jgi:arylsulfatase